MMNIINKLYSPTTTRNSSVTSNMTGSSTVDDPEHALSTPPRSTKASIAINIKNTPSTSTTQPSSTTTTTEEEQSHQDKKVCYLRFAVILVLITATTVVATLVGLLIVKQEEHEFELQYYDAVSKVATAFQDRINIKHSVAKTFSAMITSRYGNVAMKAMGRPPLWPNVTIPDFQEQTMANLAIADGRALSYNPIITQDVNRLEWEEHATKSAYILGSPQLINPPPNTTFPDNRTVSFGIYSRNSSGNVVYDPGYTSTSINYSNIMVPVWQIAPIVTNEKAVMFNLHSEYNRQSALDHMMQYKVPALTAILQLVQDSILRPSSILFYPVFDEFVDNHNGMDGGLFDTSELRNDTDHSNHNHDNQQVVGSVSIVFSWDTLLDRILPDYIKGMICVLESSTGQIFSYSISGDTVTLLGEGDQHDTNYDEYAHDVQGKLLVDNQGGEKYITYKLHMYPSSEFEAQYVTNRAAIYAAGAVLIFVFTAGLFLLYDYLVEDRQQKTARLARQTGSIVDSMFPAAFRERLYKVHNSHPRRVSDGSTGAGADHSNHGGSSSDKSSTRNRRSSVNSKRSSVTNEDIERGSSTPSRGATKRLSSIMINRSNHPKAALKQIDRFMKGLGRTNEHNSLLADQGSILEEEEPIADLFHDTSIMFSDIVGFTKWSSERTPHEVFQLLEKIFWEFDDIAARHGVFKLGTIGDCYIAVTGIPEPIDDHAIVLTQFAFDCRDKVREVCTRLDTEGLCTANLDMRFGIHSGATTAGILRGTKSRFELFGDTINTASRMESTGLGGKIQVSAETAELIRRDDKSRWLTKRDTLVAAKGKGEMITYWVEPERSHRVSFTGIDGLNNNMLNDSTENIHQVYASRDVGHLSNLDEEEKIEEDADELDCRGDISSSHIKKNDETAIGPADENV